MENRKSVAEKINKRLNKKFKIWLKTVNNQKFEFNPAKDVVNVNKA